MPEAKPSPYEICACAQLRRATRAVSQFYDDALRPSGLRITQYEILANLAAREGASMTALARRLGMERTTLTRNLGPLERRRLVESVPAGDARRRTVRLTADGRAALAAAQPLWQAAQVRIVGALGSDAAAGLYRRLAEIGKAASEV